ncbi:3-hydroxybenzoate 6-monooxygenase [Saccharothrix australiensis]|uniref:3-hydroxybenzoate 6-hydroxylase n=1 Tax=Saccharothrix australiensis TaxID=2072 RepID=A0A495W108_9PSEU|nr:3-hydroxybenzoate 6-monooxygenase [Saccharothrix australiensis]RKT55139.1 3-hydroxybenzoate 6-hydroxylase [Saccharothrix australiensis]
MSSVLIAGGGIGGIATALAVARSGHHVVVLEREPRFTELGAGIQLGPNAFRALDRLGVADAVRAGAVFVDGLNLMDGVTGAGIARLPLTGEFRERYGQPYAVVHRVDLYTALLDACREHDTIELRTDSRVERYAHVGDEVVVDLAGGATVRGDALVGADGLRSAVRAQLLDDGEPVLSGHTIYRSVIPIESLPADLRWHSVTLWAAPLRHVVHYPIAGGRSLNLAATVDDRAVDVVVGRPADRDLVLDTFASLAAVPRRFLEHGRDWRSWVLCDRDPVRRWTDGRVVLLGDAAHPMLQYAAQGACAALEDAVCLGELLAPAEPDFARAFERFTDLRAERTAWVQRLSRALGRDVYHVAGAVAERRNAALATRTDANLLELVDHLYLEPAASTR